MRRSTSEFRTQFTAYDRATAVIHTVDDAEIVIVEAIKGSMNRTRDMKEQAHEITQALDTAGFEIRYRPLGILPDEDAARYGKAPTEVARQEEAERQRAVELGLTPPAGSAARVGEARRTGDWSKVSDADWKAWVDVLRQSNPAAAAEFLPTYQDLAGLHGLYVRGDGTVKRLDRAAFDAGVLGIIERDLKPDEDAPGYLKAVRLLRGALPRSRRSTTPLAARPRTVPRVTSGRSASASSTVARPPDRSGASPSVRRTSPRPSPR
ncbi:hypothetical protein SAMN05216360_104211 [Methylobacterium phyllostachyos]|uniref:Uncharacterized protein n=1 Tax=Methylobacterium phyllostachyos TaxID=582672 RepID=A0A1G9X2G9_9HYPH|nr:hypothetical protein [Methylobacterium phyllostachyos]SDM90593.1 hypothetical protein SAMN05216360_104211 [Methylobacterium phyllostachyos]